MSVILNIYSTHLEAIMARKEFAALGHRRGPIVNKKEGCVDTPEDRHWFKCVAGITPGFYLGQKFDAIHGLSNLPKEVASQISISCQKLGFDQKPPSFNDPDDNYDPLEAGRNKFQDILKKI